MKSPDRMTRRNFFTREMIGFPIIVAGGIAKTIAKTEKRRAIADIAILAGAAISAIGLGNLIDKLGNSR